MNYVQAPISLAPQDLLCAEALFSVANGYIGLRAAFEEGYPEDIPSVRGLYANGFYDIVDMKQAEPLHGLIDKKQTIVNLADVQGIELSAEGRRFSMFEGGISGDRRELDFDAGTYSRSMSWEAGNGCELDITVKRLASFNHPSMMVIDYQVTARNRPVALSFISRHEGDVRNYCDPDDPRLASHSVQNLLVEEVKKVTRLVSSRDCGGSGLSSRDCAGSGLSSRDCAASGLNSRDSGGSDPAVSCVTSRTSRSGLAVCTAVSHTVIVAEQSEDRNGSENKSDNKSENKSENKSHAEAVVHSCETTVTGAIHSINLNALPGQAVRVIKWVAVCDSQRHGADFAAAAVAELNQAMEAGIDRLYAEQAEYVKRFWDHAAVTVDDGSDSQRISQAMRYNLFTLLQSASRDSYANVAAKGLSGEGYEGHYFWDTEMYIQPVFLLTQPELCKNLIAFRYRTLAQARDNARALGHRQGALYPWRTINGEECSGYYVSGTAAYHINGAVAHAVEQHWLATGDDDFLVAMGAEIVLEIARLWLDVGHFSGGEFRIHSVTGPDEYTCMVDNNYYTNALAKKNLHFAVRAAAIIGSEHSRRLGFTAADLDGFITAAAAMRLPYDEGLGIHAQDDSFLSKPRFDLAATPPEKHPLLLHYHPLTLYRHQVCKQADTVMAYFVCSMIPDSIMKRSFAYYEDITTHDSSLSRCMFSIVAAMLGDAEKAAAYLTETVGLDLNDSHGNTKDGIHTANMGGSYMALIYGLAGLRFTEAGISLRPLLPEGWQGYSFRFRYRSALTEVSVDRSGCHYRVLEGSADIVILSY